MPRNLPAPWRFAVPPMARVLYAPTRHHAPHAPRGMAAHSMKRARTDMMPLPPLSRPDGHRRYARLPRAIALVACAWAGLALPAPAHAAGPIGMPNPASKYCTQRGGQVIMQRTAAGVSGLCRLPSGRRVDEWKLYRHSHPAMRR